MLLLVLPAAGGDGSAHVPALAGAGRGCCWCGSGGRGIRSGAVVWKGGCHHPHRLQVAMEVHTGAWWHVGGTRLAPGRSNGYARPQLVGMCGAARLSRGLVQDPKHPRKRTHVGLKLRAACHHHCQCAQKLTDDRAAEMADGIARSVFATLSGDGQAINTRDLMRVLPSSPSTSPFAATVAHASSEDATDVTDSALKEQAEAILQRLGAAPGADHVSFEEFAAALEGLDENLLRILSTSTATTGAEHTQEHHQPQQYGDAAPTPSLSSPSSPHTPSQAADPSQPLAGDEYASTRPTPLSPAAHELHSPRHSAEPHEFVHTPPHEAGLVLLDATASGHNSRGDDDGDDDDSVQHLSFEYDSLNASHGGGSSSGHRRSASHGVSPAYGRHSSTSGSRSGRASATLATARRSGDLQPMDTHDQFLVSRADFSALMEENTQLKDENERLAHRLRDAEQKLQDNETELLQLSHEERMVEEETRAQITALKHQINTLRKERAQWEQQQTQEEASVRTQLEQRHADKIRAMEEEHHAACVRKDVEMAELQEKVMQLKDAVAARDQELNTRQRQYQTEIGVLKSELRTQQSAFEQLTAEAEELRFAADTLKEVQEENRRLRDRLDEALQAQQHGDSRRADNNSYRQGGGGDGGDEDESGDVGAALMAAEDPAKPVAFDLAVEHKLDALKAEHRRERARLQMSIVVARLRVEAMEKELKQLSVLQCTTKIENDNFQVQLEVLGKSLEDMKKFVDTDGSVVRRLGPPRRLTWNAIMRRFTPDRQS